MKKSLSLTVAILIIATCLLAQPDTSLTKYRKTDLAEQLLLKSKRQRTTGLVLLAGGLVFDAIAIANYPKDYDFIFGSTPEKESKATVSAILFIAGTAMWISSIPVLISGHINKRKANLLLKAENVKLAPQFNTNSWQLKTGLTINF
jgi:hypothetical protein